MSAQSARQVERRQDARDGFVLIAVLWILAALAGLIGAYVAYAVTMAQSSDFYLRRIGADAALSGALELAVYDLMRMEPQRRPPEGVLDYRIGDNRAQVRYASEAQRLDLNRASLDSLTSLFVEAGRGGAFSEKYAQRVVAWRQKSGGPGAAMEDLSYRAAGAAYMPRHGSFQSVEELWDVLDIPPDVVVRITPFVTVYGGRKNWRIDQPDESKNAQSGSNPAPSAPSGGAQSQGGSAQGGAAGAAAAAAQESDQTLRPTRFEIRVVDLQGRVNAAEVVAVGARDGEVPYNVLLWRTGDDLVAPYGGRLR